MIKAKIEALQKEIGEIRKVQQAAEMITEEKAENGSLLAGKTIMFPHHNEPDQTVGFRFMADGQAEWVGLGGVAVERQYKNLDDPRKFLVWWAEREDQPHEIVVAPDGKTAEVTPPYGNRATVTAKIERTR